ncbi:MAG: TonB-dependent receptor domain-containing protein [Leadbetterella sp.]
MKSFLLLFFTVISLRLLAQQPTPQVEVNKDSGGNKIVGLIVDSVSNNPVEFATISLYRASNSKTPVNGEVTDDKGRFIIKKVGEGFYLLKISTIGYKDKWVTLQEVTNKIRNLNAGLIPLTPDAKVLNEVVVEGQKSLIEEKVDRLVFNAEKDLSSRGGDAADVLRKVPSLSVDLDGNVQLRGSSNIKVLINNKPSAIMAGSISDALKQIPADQIKSVEVITSPSARYDAEGSAGIINIVLKKNTLEGYSLTTDLSVGNRGGNLALIGNLKKKKLGLNLGGFGRAGFNPSENSFEQYTKTLPIIKTLQTGESNDQMIFGRYSLSMDYDISKRQSLNGGVRFGTRTMNREQDLNIMRYRNDTLFSNTNQYIDSRNPTFNYDINLDYLYIIKPQQEFSISTLYNRSTANTNFTNRPEDAPESQILENINENLNQEFTFQVDYQAPIKKNQLYELGGKAIVRTVNTDFSYLLGGQPFSDEDRPTGFLDYNQNIGAGYFSYTYTTKKKFNVKAGARYEYTSIVADQTSVDIPIPDYGSFIPSINVSKTFKGRYTTKLGYNKRIQRPGLQQLNPNRNLANPQNPIQGNPDLKPELTDNFEISGSASIKKLYANLSVFTRFTDDAITQVTLPITNEQNLNLSGRGITTYMNIGSENSTGVNAFANYSITPKWMINGGVEGYYSYIQGQAINYDNSVVKVSSSGWNVNGRLMSFATLKHGWQVQVFSFIRGGRVVALGREGGFGFYSLGVKKDFKGKKASLGLSAQNFLTRTISRVSYTDSPLFYQNSTSNLLVRGISINFSYKIGKMGMDAFSQPKKKAKGVKNDDVKDGDGGGGSGSGGPGGGSPGGGGSGGGGGGPR